jgi:uncharacterized membrane protein
MDVLLVVLRLVHIFAGIFWAGATLMLVRFISPSVAATGETGQKFMQYLAQRTRLTPALAAAAGLSLLSGLIMYSYLNYDQDPFGSGRAVSITLGSIFGILGFIIGFSYQNRATRRMKAISTEIAASGAPPTPEQMMEMQELAKRVNDGGRYTAVVLVLAIVGMSIAEYVS